MCNLFQSGHQAVRESDGVIFAVKQLFCRLAGAGALA
jgi:hypothetical protein